MKEIENDWPSLHFSEDHKVTGIPAIVSGEITRFTDERNTRARPVKAEAKTQGEQ